MGRFRAKLLWSLLMGFWVPSLTCVAEDGKDSVYLISPSKVTLRAALLPGWGQVTNRAYWKVPVVWGGLGFMIYQTSQTADLYLTYRNAYRNRTDEDPTTVDPFEGKDTDASLIQKRNFLRRSRDAYILLSLAAYALQILDAHVDAHLKAFDRLDFSLAPASPNSWTSNPSTSNLLHPAPALFSSVHSSAWASNGGYSLTLSVRFRF